MAEFASFRGMREGDPKYYAKTLISNYDSPVVAASALEGGQETPMNDILVGMLADNGGCPMDIKQNVPYGIMRSAVGGSGRCYQRNIQWLPNNDNAGATGTTYQLVVTAGFPCEITAFDVRAMIHSKTNIQVTATVAIWLLVIARNNELPNAVYSDAVGFDLYHPEEDVICYDACALAVSTGNVSENQLLRSDARCNRTYRMMTGDSVYELLYITSLAGAVRLSMALEYFLVI